MASANDDPPNRPHATTDPDGGAPNENTPLLAAGGQEAAPSNGDPGREFGQHAKKWRRDRWLSLGISVLLMALVIVLIVLFGVFRSRKMSNSTSALCLTPACIHIASEFLYNLAPNYQEIDPCTNFDELTCQGWDSRHDLRPDQGQTNVFNTIAEDGETIIRHILEGSYPGNSTHSSFSPRNLAATSASADELNFDDLQRAYNACLALSDIKKLGLTPLEAIFSDIAELFPVENSSYGDSASTLGTKPGSLANVTIYFEKLGGDLFESLGAGQDDKTPDIVIIQAYPETAIGLPSKDYYADEDTVTQYQDAMRQVLAAVHPNKKARSAADKYAAAVVEFEATIAAMAPDNEDLQDITKTYNPMSVADTAKLAPQLGLEEVLKALVPSNYTLDTMITAFPGYLTNLSDYLSTAPKDTIQTFLYWKAIQNVASYIEADELKPLKAFNNILSGREPDATSERYKICISHVDNGLGWILSRFYVEAAFSAQAKTLGDQIISDIREQFIARIKTLAWMDDQTKKVAIDKATNIIQKIGYPTASPNMTDPEDLLNYYAGLDISDVYFNNSLNMDKLAVNKSWSQLGKPYDRNTWFMTADTVNAYYNPPGNEIVFPAAIMQFPVFGAGFPGYVNYGAFGSVAGHELSHAFDNNGRHYDADGKYTDWWTNHTVEEFTKRADCFVEEYNNFTVIGTNGTIHVHGAQTLGENIADAGGLTASFNAWNARRQDYPDSDLPGLDYFTQEQLFYIAYGNFWCAKYTKAALTRGVLLDPHSPNMWRLQGAAMMNARGFKEAFNCPSKEPTCELW